MLHTTLHSFLVLLLLCVDFRFDLIEREQTHRSSRLSEWSER